MAKTDPIHGNMSGKIGSLVYYQLRGSDKTIVRTKPYISKSAIKHHRRYAKTRLENSEFKGTVRAAKNIASSLYAVRVLGDYNSFGDLVRVCRYIQQADTINPRGRRSVLISRHTNLLHGFSFNRYHSFDTLVRPAMTLETDRENGSARLIVPRLQPGIHLFNPASQPFYRLVLTLATVNDVYMPELTDDYTDLTDNYAFGQATYSPWTEWKNAFPETELNLQLMNWRKDEHAVLIAGVGIEFGRLAGGGEIVFTKYAGAGKIWGGF